VAVRDGGAEAVLKEHDAGGCDLPDYGYSSKNIGEDEMDILRIIAAVILPPLGVFLQVGVGKHFWINIILTLLGYIPGIIHAVWVIARK